MESVCKKGSVIIAIRSIIQIKLENLSEIHTLP